MLQEHFYLKLDAEETSKNINKQTMKINKDLFDECWTLQLHIKSYVVNKKGIMMAVKWP